MRRAPPTTTPRLTSPPRRAARVLWSGLATLLLAACQPPPGPPPLRVLVYGDSNSWGAGAVGAPGGRLPAAQRWPQVMAATLGPRLRLVVDALPGRSTDIDMPRGFGGAPGAAFNGARCLAPALARHAPLDGLVILLGTNDLHADLLRDAATIATAAVRLAREAQAASPGLRVLVICPPEPGAVDGGPLAGPMRDAPQRARGWCTAYAAAGAAAGVPVLDASAVTATHGSDGIHLTAEDHARLGRATAAALAPWLAPVP